MYAMCDIHYALEFLVQSGRLLDLALMSRSLKAFHFYMYILPKVQLIVNAVGGGNGTFISFCALPSNVLLFTSGDPSSDHSRLSSHLSVISGFLVFSESFLHLSFYGIHAVIIICIVINSPSLCSS